MAKIIEEETKDISENEWQQLEEALNVKPYEFIVEGFRRKNNRPIPVMYLFDEDKRNQEGQSDVNLLLRNNKVPFTLATIGPHGKKQGEQDRKERLLAFVRK